MINEKKKKIQKAKQKDAIAHEKRRAAMSPEERNQAKKKNATANEKRRAAHTNKICFFPISTVSPTTTLMSDEVKEKVDSP